MKNPKTSLTGLIEKDITAEKTCRLKMKEEEKQTQLSDDRKNKIDKNLKA